MIYWNVYVKENEKKIYNLSIWSSKNFLFCFSFNSFFFFFRANPPPNSTTHFLKTFFFFFLLLQCFIALQGKLGCFSSTIPFYLKIFQFQTPPTYPTHHTPTPTLLLVTAWIRLEFHLSNRRKHRKLFTYLCFMMEKKEPPSVCKVGVRLKGGWW